MREEPLGAPGSDSPSRVRLAVRALLWGLLFYAAGQIGVRTSLPGNPLALVAPASGVLVVWFAFTERARLPYDVAVLSVAGMLLAHSLGLPWPLAVLVVLLLGAGVGFLNGVLVEVARIDSFIATLGTGTVLYALALWHTGGRQVVRPGRQVGVQGGGVTHDGLTGRSSQSPAGAAGRCAPPSSSRVSDAAAIQAPA